MPSVTTIMPPTYTARIPAMPFDPWHQASAAFDVMVVSQSQPHAIAQRQASRLARLVETAREHSPFYRETLAMVRRDAPNAPVALASLPTVTRHTLMRRFDDWVTDVRLTRTCVRDFMAQTHNIGQPLLGEYTVWESSGTSGEPGYFVQDAQTMAIYDALEGLRRSSRRWFDPLFLGERIAFVGVTGGHFASYASVQRLRRLNPWLARAVGSFSVLQPTAALIDALNDFAPTVIATYPTAAAVLADEARHGALRTRPREVWTGGETLGLAVRQHVEAALGCTVRNSYGASEFLTIGWECSHGRMHANTDWVILEPVDVHHRAVAPGVEPATTLLTNLANLVQPLIRYDIGDRVVVAPERCACGSPLPVIEVQGRQDDPLVMAGRDGASITLVPLALTTVIEDEAGVFDFQLCQRDASTLVLRLGGTGTDSVDAMRRCRSALRGFAERQGLEPIRIIGENGRALRHGRSGKLQRVIARPRPR